MSGYDTSGAAPISPHQFSTSLAAQGQPGVRAHPAPAPGASPISPMPTADQAARKSSM